MNASTIRARCPSPEDFRAARLAARDSQEDAARAVGVSRLTIFRFEAGQTSNPHLTVASGLTRVYRAYLRAVA